MEGAAHLVMARERAEASGGLVPLAVDMDVL